MTVGTKPIPVKEVSIIDQLNLILNIMSAVGGLLVVGLVGLIHIFDAKLMDRVSIRFTLAISFIDFLKAMAIIIYSQEWTVEPLCTLVGFGIQWLTLLYLFYNVAIAVNLQLVFINGIIFNPRWERVYWFMASFMATMLPIFPLMAGKFGASPENSTCEYKEQQSLDSCIWLSATFLIWISLSILYCTIVVILTIVMLQRKVTVLDRVTGQCSNVYGQVPISQEEAALKAALVKKDIRRLIRRIVLYCVIPVVTQIGYLIARTSYCFASDVSDFLRLASVVGTDIPGILNLIALLIDPAFENAIRCFIKAKLPCKKPPATISLDWQDTTTANNSGDNPVSSTRSSTYNPLDYYLETDPIEGDIELEKLPKQQKITTDPNINLSQISSSSRFPAISLVNRNRFSLANPPKPQLSTTMKPRIYSFHPSMSRPITQTYFDEEPASPHQSISILHPTLPTDPIYFTSHYHADINHFIKGL